MSDVVKMCTDYLEFVGRVSPDLHRA